MKTKREALLDLWDETKSQRVADELIRNYGPLVLMDMGKGGMTTLLSDILVYEKYNILYDVTGVSEIRRIFKEILDRIEVGYDNEFIQGVCKLISKYHFNLGGKLIRKEGINFLISLLKNRKLKSLTLDEITEIDVNEMIIPNIFYNNYLSKEDILDICDEVPELYEYLIGNIFRYVDISNMYEFIFNIHHIYEIMEMRYDAKENNGTNNFPCSVDTLFNKGVNRLLNTRWVYEYMYSLFITIPIITEYNFTFIKDTYKKVIDVFLANNTNAMENSIKLKEASDKSEFNTEYTTLYDLINRNSLVAIFYVLFYGKEIKYTYRNFMYWEDRDLESQIDYILESFEFLANKELINKDVLSVPTSIIDYASKLQLVDIAEAIIEEDSEFNIDEFLAEL